VRRLGLTFIVATVAVLLAAPSASAALEQGTRGNAPAAVVFSPDRVIVEWAAGASPAERRVTRAEADVDFARDLGSRRFQLVETEPGQTPREAVRELEADPAVALAARDGYDRLDAIPNDPLFNQLWGLRNTGLGINGFVGALAGRDIDASSAWGRTVGTPATVVADIDTGYRFEHPDLADVAWTNPGEMLDGVDNDGNGIVDDIQGADFIGADGEAPTVDGDPTDDDLYYGGHGVHTAGTIGAEGNNGIGITGVAQDARIMPLRVCAPLVASTGDHGCLHSSEIAAINYAGAKGARVANMSLGGDVDNPAVAAALAANPQTLFVISAGNDARDNDLVPQYPCSYDPLAEGKGAVDNVICVAATDQADRLASFSNWGAVAVDLGAPGTETLSAFPVGLPLKEDFELNDFASRWSASGASGGFARTNEAPLTSFGMSDSPGGAPVAGSVRGSTSAPLVLPPGYNDCDLEMTRAVSGSSGSLFFEVLLDGEPVMGIGTRTSGRFSHGLLDALGEGGVVTLRFSYTASANPGAGDGVWLDDVRLRCIALVGEADGYAFLQGTSMAAPHVTGAAALLFSLKPSASVTEVRRALLDSVDRVPALAGKTTSGGRLDAAAALDLFDTVPPPSPALTATSPASPAKSTQPRLLGSAQPGTAIDIYANAICSGLPVASGSAAQFAAPGIAVTVGDGTVSEFSARATDLAPLASACSAPISYWHKSDLVPPGPPQLLSSAPSSPGPSGTPRILGTAEAGSTVSIYAGLSCVGLPVTVGSAAELDSPGLLVEVAEGVTATFSATATDASDNTSACSAPISYGRPKAADPGRGDGAPIPIPPPTAGGPSSAPACVVPKLAGKTLARARAALTAAACKLGKVRKPRSPKGKRLAPLVVKSSHPAARARPAGGKVALRLGPKPRKVRR
jgi:subtilisin family serine protease